MKHTETFAAKIRSIKDFDALAELEINGSAYVSNLAAARREELAKQTAEEHLASGHVAEYQRLIGFTHQANCGRK